MYVLAGCVGCVGCVSVGASADGLLCCCGTCRTQRMKLATAESTPVCVNGKYIHDECVARRSCGVSWWIRLYAPTTANHDAPMHVLTFSMVSLDIIRHTHHRSPPSVHTNTRRAVLSHTKCPFRAPCCLSRHSSSSASLQLPDK